MGDWNRARASDLVFLSLEQKCCRHFGFLISHFDLFSLATLCQKLNLFLKDERNKNFMGIGLQNRRNYDVKRGLDEENSSACLEDEINLSSTQVDNKAKETLSASYCKLKSVTEGNNPVDKPKKVSYRNI